MRPIEVVAVQPPFITDEPVEIKQPEVVRRSLKVNQHSEDAVVPAQKGGKKLTFEEQMELYD